MSRRAFGNVRQLPSGRYQARYRLPDLSYRTAPETFVRKRDAQRWLSEIETSLAKGTWVDPTAGNVTVKAWAETWLASNTGNLKPKTVVSYQSLVRAVIVPTLGEQSIGKLTRGDVQTWVLHLAGERGLSASRTRQAYRLLSQMLSGAELDGVIPRTPCRAVRLPRLPEHDPVILTPEQVASLVGVMSAPHDVFVLTLAYTGMRFGEGAALQRRRVDAPGRMLVVAASLSDANGKLTIEDPKSHQHRLITLPASLADRLADHLDARVRPEEDAFVFTSPEGLAIRHPNFMRRVWHPACLAVGFEARPHDLRASHASWLYDQGWSPVEIASRLGHDKATVTTKHYARAVAGRDVEIAHRLDAVLGGIVRPR